MKIVGEETVTIDPNTKGKFKRDPAWIICHLEVNEDGEIILVLGRTGDYHVYETNGELAICFRPADARERMPNWPNPEPTE